MRTTWCLLGVTAVLLSCGGPIQDVELHGYVDGKMQAKYLTRVFKIKLADGSPGYRLETDFTYAVGNARRVENTSMVLARQDMTLVESTSTFDNNGAKSSMVTRVGAQEIRQIQNGEEATESAEKKVAIQQPVYHIHPMLYSRDVTKPGQEKVYRTFNESKFQLQDIKVIYVGEETIRPNGQALQSRHYKVENSSNPGTFLDYYLDAAGKLLKIVHPPMEFRIRP